MRTSIFLVVGLFVVATMASAAMFAGNITSAATGDDPTESSGTFEFYYCGSSQWIWAFYNGGYTGVDIDPTNGDEEGFFDGTTNGYEVTFVDSTWGSCDEGSYETRLLICADTGGIPDFDNPLYDTGYYEPSTSGWDAQEVDPPVMFLGGEVCWVIYWVQEDANPHWVDPDGIPGGHPGSDGDGNSGHSWASFDDGASWELILEEGGVDWLVKVFAEPIESIDTESLGHIKSLYQ